MSLLWCVSARECPRSDAVPRPGRAIGRDLSGHSGSPAEPDWPKCPSMRSKGPGIRLALVVERRRRATQEGGAMPNATIDTDRIRIGPRFAVTLHRTLRIPDDGGAYPLAARPRHVSRCGACRRLSPIESLPSWPSGGAFIAMYQREAHVDRVSRRVVEAECRDGRGRAAVNALTGERDGPELSHDPQNYLVHRRSSRGSTASRPVTAPSGNSWPCRSARVTRSRPGCPGRSATGGSS